MVYLGPRPFFFNVMLCVGLQLRQVNMHRKLLHHSCLFRWNLLRTSTLILYLSFAPAPRSFDLSKMWAKYLKIRTKSHKVWAQMFRHLCSHCVVNEPDCRNASEFDFLIFSQKTYEDLFLCGLQNQSSFDFIWFTPRWAQIFQIFAIFIRVSRQLA